MAPVLNKNSQTGVIMQAVQFESFGESSVLKVAELPRPKPRGNEVLIEVAAAGVSYVDVRQRQGAYNRSETRVGGVQLPNVPGLQAVGRVVDVGPEADSALKGRKVVAAVDKGAYAEYLIAPSTLCVTVPEGLDDATLAVLPMQGLTAYCLLTKSTQLRAGESVLIHAAGSGVGALAVQIAKILGAGKICNCQQFGEARLCAHLGRGCRHRLQRRGLDPAGAGCDIR
jgi:NADPH:quinone reductase